MSFFSINSNIIRHEWTLYKVMNKKKEGKNSRKHVELIGYWNIRFLSFFFFSFGQLVELLFEERLVLDKPLLKMKINKLPLESTIEQATVTISLTPQNNSNC